MEDAKRKGIRENKWLLINIQDTENMCSHILNRDIWKDKDLMPIIKKCFIFYQWITKTDNAKRIINLYKPATFPCIFVVNPSTGRKEHEFNVPESPDKIVSLKPKIIEFLDDFPFPKLPMNNNQHLLNSCEVKPNPKEEEKKNEVKVYRIKKMRCLQNMMLKLLKHY